MESFRRPGGRRVLLPAEVELCETVGITEDEYWYFVELTQAFNGKRPKEYDDIPYIINMPQVLFVGGAISGGLTVAGQIILGVILTVVSVLLAPKPRAPKTPPSLTTAGQTGPKRFAPQTGFNSVQELANLGEIVPLVFTKQETEVVNDYRFYYGGVRVNTRLLWSQMLSLGTGQQLKALFMIGLANLAAKPEFAGYAIGDLLLKNYINKKLALYIMTDGGRPQEKEERYSEGKLDPQIDRNGSVFEDVMSVDWDENRGAIDNIVSSARTPNTQVQFGAYTPMPNSMRYRLPYELVLKQKNLKDRNKKDITKKRQKIRTNFPRYCSLYAINDVKEDRTNAFLNVDDTIRYTIADYDTEEEFEGEFEPWGVEDVKSAVDATREEADDAISIGESYLAGSALVVCIDRSNTIWNSKTYQNAYFRCDTPGLVDIRTGTSDLKAAHKGYELLTLQKVAIGTISNSKACDVTEIGLKSKVFKQVTSFPNVNSHPGAVEMKGVPQDSTSGVVKRYQDDDGSISLGPMSKYLMRYSFFRLQARIAGVVDADWNYIDGGEPFGIKGNSPQPQYNFIRINHHSAPKKEYEFRFLPFPGNLIKRNFVDQADKFVKILNSAGELHSYTEQPNEETYQVYYKGTRESLVSGDVSNTEWHLGDLPTDVDGGKVNKLLQTINGTIPKSTRWIEVDRKTSNMDANLRNEAVIHYTPNTHGCTWVWSTSDRPPHWREYFGNRNRTINDPLRRPDTITIGDPYTHPYVDRDDGFRYGVGPHITTKTGKPKNQRGEYYGIIKYEMKTADVEPVVHENISTTGGSGSGLKVNIKVYLDPKNNQYAAAQWEISEKGSGYKDDDKINIPATGDFPGENGINVVTDFSEFVTEPWPEGKNLNPFDAINDYYQYDAERSSHLDGPEHEIVYVNEQSSLGFSPQYAVNDVGIANVALRLSSSKEWNSFSQFSVYIKEGIKVERLVNNTTGATNLFPEIVYALLTDKRFGLANSIGVSSVDKDRMITAAKFCEANKFYWDGVITDKQNVREFIYQNAIFNLLDFTILGGKFSLYPSVPFGSDTYLIAKAKKPTVRALFTDGNTRNLKVSFLSPEERQNFIGTVYYRKEVPNGFSETQSLTKAVAEDDLITREQIEKLPTEVFDMSDFCTSESHAEEFLNHALMIRKKVDHGIKFETTPQAALGLKPGDYIRFISEATHTSRFENGVISPDGIVQSVGNDSLTDVNIYHWKPGTDEVLEATLNVVNGKATDANLYGSVFTVKQTSESNRLYKVESLTYNDEGLIEVSGSHAPLLSDGTLATINYEERDFTGM